MAIWDCCFFANELDCLEIRLGTLYDHVDKFVIVESPWSIAGQMKELFYAANRERFKPWADKIVHVVLDELPMLEQRGPGHATNVREQAMRNGITRGIVDAKLSDIIVISDADEVVSPEALAEYHPSMGVAVPEQAMSHYWLNCISEVGWGGTRIAICADVRNTSPDYMRRFGHNVLSNSQKLLANGFRGGWHMTYQGGVQAIRWKLNNFLHCDLAVDHFTDEVWLRTAIHTGLDLFRRPGRNKFVPMEHHWVPPYVQKHPEKFAHMLKPGAMFREYLIGNEQLCQLIDTARWRSRDVDGLTIDLGCWEGNSTVALANAVFPDKVTAVDNWTGHSTEGKDFWTERVIGQGRDVYGQFLRNMELLTPGNVKPVRMDHGEFCRNLGEPVRFAHIDGSHDYAAVADQIRNLQKKMPLNATLCGDDFQTASAARTDLDGGVERAVRELCPGVEILGNFWIYTKRA